MSNTDTEFNTEQLEQLSGANQRRSFCPSEVKAVNREEQEILHLISTGARDRMGDVVTPKGAYLKNYKKNPVVLMDHDYSLGSIIGRSVHIEVDDKGVWSRTRFRDTPLALEAFNLAAESLGGWSIGFAPMKSHSIKQGKEDGCPICTELWEQLSEGKEAGDYVPGSWGQHFKQWELLEYSAVAIPANQEIVNNAVQRGLVSEANVCKFFVQDSKQPEPRVDETPADGPTAEKASTENSAAEGSDEQAPREPLVDPEVVRELATPTLQRIDRMFDRAAAARAANDILARTLHGEGKGVSR